MPVYVPAACKRRGEKAGTTGDAFRCNRARTYGPYRTDTCLYAPHADSAERACLLISVNARAGPASTHAARNHHQTDDMQPYVRVNLWGVII